MRVLSPGSSNENPHGTLHMVYKEMQAASPMVPNRKFTILRTCLQIDQGTSGFAFAAERMVAWLERSCERGSHKNATCRIKAPGYKEKVPWILEKLSLMNFGESMVRGLFENVGLNEDCNSTIWRSVTGSEDMKVYDSLYKSSANFEVAGSVVTFGVRHSPELVLETLGDKETHHEVWDVLGGLTKLCTLTKYSTPGTTYLRL
nr:homeobox-leucine zipper protein HDG11-like [Tanacetum cinerariifolium]